MAIAVERLEVARDRFLRELARSAAPAWLARPDGSGWSPSEITEHVTIANRSVLAVLDQRLGPLAGEPTAVEDDEIPYLFYRGEEPPNVAAPSGSWTNAGEAAAQLRQSADAITVWTGRTTADLRTVGAPHPAFGTLDGVQWVLFAGAHMERHRAQLLGVLGASA